MPNTFAHIVFFIWPLVVLWLLIKYPTKKALFLAITLSILFLPANYEIDLPGFPPLGREALTSISLILFLFLLGKKLRVFPLGMTQKLIIGHAIVILLSASTNIEPVLIGGKLIPGITIYDGFSNLSRLLLGIAPFFIGRYFFSDLKDTELMFKLFVVIGLLYSLPMLLEVRISPQLHRIFYGYHPSEFVQQIRGDSFRPTVFLGHGLPLAFWLSTCIIAALALYKNKVRYTFLPSAVVVLYLMGILILTNTWSALVYSVFGGILILRFSASKQIKWSLLIGAFVLIYPIAKTTGVFPDKEIISNVREFSMERAQSLEVRFLNENIVLEHAMKKPFFGWSGWGRNRIYDSYGKDITVTDGRWLIEISLNGIGGFIFYYAVLLTPLYLATKNIRHIEDTKEKVYFSALAIILAVGIADSVPNTGMGPMHLLLAGALLGQSEFLKKQSKSSSEKSRRT